ncbi:MAG: ATP-binding protein [Oscillochloris sp.]|nr:ATP-binding protein [Oscillochloris sp.]
MRVTPEDILRNPPNLIGRSQELTIISNTILDPASQRAVVYIEGQGGIGKTRLLSEIHQQFVAADGFLITDIIDLYLTQHHQPVHLMEVIAQQLQDAAERHARTGRHFVNFLRAEAEFFALSGEGSDEHRAMLEASFRDDMRVLAEQARIVLLFDTFEKLHPYIADAAEFDFRKGGRLERWLIDMLASFPNMVVVLAGRPRQRQREMLMESCGALLRPVLVQPFTRAETAAYIESFGPLADQEFIDIDVLHAVSGGRPVVLSIALACAQRGLFDMVALPAGFDSIADNDGILSDAFIQLILNDLQQRRPDLTSLLAKAVYLRKGLRASLLEQIALDGDAVVDSAQIAADLEELSGFVFVKRMSASHLMLHDEMYELLFQRLSDEQASAWWESAVRFLDQRIAATHEKLKQLRDEQDALAISLALIRQQQKLQTLQVERLFYQFSRNVPRGYRTYRELASTAIIARDEDFDAQLQEELARFFDADTAWGRYYRQALAISGLSWDQIIYDEGIRWVFRRINAHIPGTNRYQEAIAIAERVRCRFPEIYQGETLARGDLDAAQLQAEVYVPELTLRGDEISANYERLTAELGAIVAGAATDEDDVNYARFVLANAYNYWGYYERTHERLQSACDKYREALRFYRPLGLVVASLQAVTFNNLGYAFGRQGDSARGLEYLNQALTIVERMGAMYRIATTLNTRAHLLTDINNLDQALDEVLRARALFESLSSKRGLALCANAEGRIRTRRADGQRAPAEQDVEFAAAAARYRMAIDLFDNEIKGELVRRIETRVSLGKSYRAWSAARISRSEPGREQQDLALNLLHEALNLCTPKTQRTLQISIYEEIATILIDRGMFDTALPMLDQARALLPDVLQSEEMPADTDQMQEMRLYWLRFALLEIQYARCMAGQSRYEPACIHFARAFSGLLRFSTRTPQIDRFHMLGKQLLLSVGNRAQIMQLAQYVQASAARQNLPADGILYVQRVFDHALQDLDLLDA